MSKASAGGSAATGGIRFETQLGTYFACHILAEKEATPIDDLIGGQVLDFIRFQSGEPMDDLLVGH